MHDARSALTYGDPATSPEFLVHRRRRSSSELPGLVGGGGRPLHTAPNRLADVPHALAALVVALNPFELAALVHVD